MTQQQTIALQQKMAFLARLARDIRGDLLLYTKSAKEVVAGAFLTSGEGSEALQKALPRLEIYAAMGEHSIALGDLFDRMVVVVKEQNSPEGKIILPASTLAAQAAPANGRNATEEHAGSLYEAYCSAVGGKAFDGSPLPLWPEFRADIKKRKQSDAWVAVAALSLSARSDRS